MDSYRFLSAYYDRFTEDVGYEEWANFFEQVFQKEKLQPKLVLDLACGTGSLTKLLAQRGYEMIGVDASEEMLMQAQENTVDCVPRPLFIHQRMEMLDLYGTIDACLCCLDSMNYVTEEEKLQEAFRRVQLFLNPGGLFLFDINTPDKFAKMDGNCYLREDEDVYCVWQADVQEDRCTYLFDIFERQENDLWSRFQETHKERIYQPEALIAWLQNAGFQDCKIYPGLSFDEVTGGEDRLFFSARKPE